MCGCSRAMLVARLLELAAWTSLPALLMATSSATAATFESQRALR
jgi:hypothetical protein